MEFFDLSALFPRKIFSDFRFEIELDAIKKGFEDANEIRVDFRYFKWVDLWALIQLLFLIDQFPEKKVSFYFLTPEACVEEEKKRKAGALIKFLSEMEFFNRATEINSDHCRFFFQETRTINKIKEKFVDDIKHLSLIYKESYNISETDRHIIPIMRISQINMDSFRERLYLEARQMFDRLFSEAIVQKAGIGDCLLAELVSNVKEHAESDGFLALRAVGGIKRLRKLDEQKYEHARLARVNHHLEDWRQFFKERYDDGYFELIVSDRGPGISSTISKHPSLKGTGAENIEATTHERLKFALLPSTSRLTNFERKEKKLTEFTGLGATIHVLNSHGGYLMIREKKSRHIFFGEESNYSFFETLHPEKKKRVPFERREDLPEKKPLSAIRGTSLTAVIPLTGGAVKESRVSLKPMPLSLAENRSLFEKIKFFKVVDTDHVQKSYSETLLSNHSWDFVVEQIRELPTQYRSVLIDLHNASVDKNRIWRGIATVKKICDRRDISLFICGVDDRIARRLEDWAAMDSNKINKGEPWIMLGSGDDDTFYLFGNTELTKAQQDKIEREIGSIFDKSQHLNVRKKTEELLNNSHYIDWIQKDEIGNMSPVLRSNFPVLRSLLQQSYQELLQHHIGETSAWIKNDPVQLIGGDVVSPYLCIHSVTQINGIYPDIARLIRIISNEFSYDFVLSVGTAAKISIARDLSNYQSKKMGMSANGSRIVYYSYQDYFSFDHGEDTKSIIRPNSKVLMIVDGIRKSEHCEQAIDHVQDCGAHVVAVLALIDLNGDLATSIQDIPVRSAISMPVRLVEDRTPVWKEDPYSHKLIAYRKKSRLNDLWNIFYEPARSYKLAETFGIIQKGHSVFLGRHVRRSFVLSYLFDSKSTLNIELASNIISVIEDDNVDTVMYPEHSPIGKLIEEIIPILNKKNINIVICRRAAYPGMSNSYTLNNLGSATLSKSKSVLILDDQVYSGHSLKSMINLCERNSPDIKKIHVYVVIESMLKAERKLFSTFFQSAHFNSNRSEIDIKFSGFMRFSVNKYWDSKSCPICEVRAVFQKNRTLKNQFVESNYAERRISELEPNLLDYETQSRKPLTRLDQVYVLTREGQEPVSVTTLEGFELFCEVAYVEGDIGWLIDGLRPGTLNTFPPDIIISTLELLAQDLSLLLRVRLYNKFIRHLVALLDYKELKGKKLSRFLETIATLPLYFLKNELWETLWEVILAEPPNTFYLCYPGAHFLLQEITRRPAHALGDKLLSQFEEMADKALDSLPRDVEFKKKECLIKCLRRSYQFENTLTFSWLVSHISQLIAYPIKKGQITNHQLLYRDLIGLSSSNKNDETSAFIAAIQMLGHLRYCFDQMKSLFPEQFSSIISHNKYRELIVKMESLQNNFPYEGKFGENMIVIRNLAEDIAKCLFSAGESIDLETTSFQDALETFLNQNIISMGDIWASFYKIDGKAVDITYTSKFNKDVKVVFDERSIHLVFEEVVKNLEKCRQKYVEKSGVQKSGDLYSSLGYNYKLPLEINFEHSPSILTITIENECTDQDINNVDQGKGRGISQIRQAMEKFGYAYELDFKRLPTSVILVQTFELRKV